MPSRGRSAIATGPGGAASSRPVSFIAIVSSSASTNGSAQAPTQRSQLPTGSCRRRTRAKPSIAASSTGSSSAAPSSRTGHSGSSFLSISTYASGAGMSLAASSAEIDRSAARPKTVMRASDTSWSAAGGSSPLADSSTAGMPAPTNGPCRPGVSGAARRANWLAGRDRRLPSPASLLSASSTVRRSSSGASAASSPHGTTSGWRVSVPARSPSTSTASTSPPGCSASSRAASRPPLTDASTSVRSSVRAPSTRDSSSSAAVPDSCAFAGLPIASRAATTSIRRLEKPVRCPITVSTWRSPTLVCALRRWTETSKPFALSPSRTRAATRRSPIEPGWRFGAASASCCSVAYAPTPSKASEASGVVTPRGCSRSEKPTSTNTNRTGRKAAR